MSATALALGWHSVINNIIPFTVVCVLINMTVIAVNLYDSYFISQITINVPRVATSDTNYLYLPYTSDKQ